MNFSLKNQLQPSLLSWVLNFFLALIIYCNAEVGRLLGIPADPLSISLVWPATGVSLAALLLFGNKMWSGVFAGNFLYNIIHFWPESASFFSVQFVSALVGATVISLGSLVQALVAAWIMQRFCTAGYFNTVKDLIIFLLPAGLGASLIACTVGVITLYLYGAIASQALFTSWLTYWIGDTIGVYILTPFLVVWSTHKAKQVLREYSLEAFFMCLVFLVISVLSFVYDYPLAHLYLPLCVWVSYRFRMHGATLIVFAFAFTAIVPTCIGKGSFVTILTGHPLIILVTFIEVIVFTCFILAAIVNEREVAWNLLRYNNIDLQQALDMQKEELREMGRDVLIKEKLATLSVLTSRIAKLMHFPLKMSRNFIEASLDSVRRLQSEAERQQKQSAFTRDVTATTSTLEGYLLQTATFETQAREIAHLIKEQTAFTVLGTKHKIRIDIGGLLESCLSYIESEVARKDPSFNFTTVKRLDQKIKLSFFQPEELAHAFIYLFRYALSSMKAKSQSKGIGYVPILEVDTKEALNQVTIVIRDNGDGVEQDRLDTFFQSFLATENMARVNHMEESLSLGLSLAHDIIVSVYQGKIVVHSVQDEYTQIEITLPKIVTE